MSKNELDEFLKQLGVCDDGAIDRALSYFRSKYSCRINKYPGDHELYDMFKRCILEGLSINDSVLKCQSVIDREMIFLDAATATAIVYHENWFNK